MDEGRALSADLDVFDDGLHQGRPADRAGCAGTRGNEAYAGPRAGSDEARPPRRLLPGFSPEGAARRWHETREHLREVTVPPLEELEDRGSGVLEPLEQVRVGVQQGKHPRRLSRGDEV